MSELKARLDKAKQMLAETRVLKHSGSDGMSQNIFQNIYSLFSIPYDYFYDKQRKKLNDIYSEIVDIFDEDRTLAKDALDVLKFGVENKKFVFLPNIYDAFRQVTKDNLELIKESMGSLKTLSKQKQGFYDLNVLYENIFTIKDIKITKDVIKSALLNKANDHMHIALVFRRCREVLKNEPESKDVTIEIMRFAMENMVEFEGALGRAYKEIKQCLKENPDKYKELFEVYKIGLKNKNNTVHELREEDVNLGVWCQNYPQYSDEIVKSLDIVMQNKGDRKDIDKPTVRHVCDFLGLAVEKCPAQAENVFDIAVNRFSKDEKNYSIVEYSNKLLGNIAQFGINYEDRVYEVLMDKIKNGNKKIDQLSEASPALVKVVQKKPSYAKEVYGLFKNRVLNGAKRIEEFEAFGYAAVEDKELIPEFLQIIKNNDYQIDRNNRYYRHLYVALGEILKKAPEFDKEVLDIVKDKFIEENPSAYSDNNYFHKYFSDYIEKTPSLINKEVKISDLMNYSYVYSTSIQMSRSLVEEKDAKEEREAKIKFFDRRIAKVLLEKISDEENRVEFEDLFKVYNYNDYQESIVSLMEKSCSTLEIQKFSQGLFKIYEIDDNKLNIIPESALKKIINFNLSRRKYIKQRKNAQDSQKINLNFIKTNER